jgi:hypothetical protein
LCFLLGCGRDEVTYPESIPPRPMPGELKLDPQGGGASKRPARQLSTE